MTTEPEHRSESKAFLDTTVVTDRVFASAARKWRVERELPKHEVVRTSRFVQLEFKRGPFWYLARFHARAVDGRQDYADLCAWADRLSRGKYNRRFGEAMVKTLQRFRKDEHLMGPGFRWPAALPPGGLERLVLDNLRDYLGFLVRNAWKRAFEGIEITDATGCLEDLAQPQWDQTTGTIDRSDWNKYAAGKTKQLAEFVGKQSVPFRKVLAALQAIADNERDLETSNRIDAIKTVLDEPDTAEDKHMRRLGDAFIAVECPDDHLLLNNNQQHFAPICAALGKAHRCPYSEE